MNEESVKSGVEPQASPPPDLFKDLLSNPDLIRRVGALIGGMGETEAPKKEEKNDAEAVSVGSVLPSEDALSALLSDPTFLQKLPQMIAVMKPLLGASTPHGDEHHPLPQRASDNSRDQLLLALKPFLSQRRCEAIDSMIRIARLGALFGQFK